MDRKQLARIAKNWKLEYQKALAWSQKENDQEIHSALKKIESQFISLCETLEKYSGAQGELFGSEISNPGNNPDEIHAALDQIVEKVSKLKIGK